MRFAVDAALAVNSGRPVVLLVNHGRGGGSQRHVNELAGQLVGQACVFLLAPENGSGLLHLQAYDPDGPRGGLFFAEQYMQLLRDTLRALRVARIHFHHSIDLVSDVLSLPEHLGCRYDITIHDYYSACPQVTLADEKGRYCGAPDERGCNACLVRRPVAGVANIESWRGANALFLQGAERVFVPSQDTQARMRGYFPLVNFIHAQHEAEVRMEPIQLELLQAGDPLRVLVLGALSAFKGADTLESVAMLARGQRAPVELHLLGYSYRPLRTWPVTALRVHGAYKDEELQERIQRIKPHVVWFPGSCPETWSYTLSSVLEAGLPVVAPQIGAFSERLAGREWSWQVATDRAPEEILEHLLQVVRPAFVGGKAPEILAGDACLADYRYAEAYVMELQVPSPDDKETEWPALVAQWQSLSSKSDSVLLPNVRPEIVRKMLVYALQKGWLSALSARLPYALKQNIKNALRVLPR